jgi:hypothetical protein
MGAPYDNIPGVDSSDNFHPDIQQALATVLSAYPQFVDKFFPKTAPALSAGVDLNNYIVPGYWQAQSNAAASGSTNFPVPASGQLEVIGRADGTSIIQRYTTYATMDVYVRKYYAGTWSAWIQQATVPWANSTFSLLNHTHLASDITITELGIVDLNTLTTTGDYIQSQNAEATLVNNYPVNVAGLLQVKASGSFIYQYYTAYQPDTRFFWRAKYNTTWSAWKGGLTNVDNTSDANKPVSTAQQAAIDLLSKGIVAYADQMATSGAIGNQTVVLNIPSVTFKANRRYRVAVSGTYYCSGTSSTGVFAIATCPTTDSAGSVSNLTTIRSTADRPNAASEGRQVIIMRDGLKFATDTTLQIKYTIQRLSGADGFFSQASSTDPLTLVVYDDGMNI